MDVSQAARPRRFGKTLFMDTLREFFDIRRDSRELFEGLQISKHQEFDLKGYRTVLCYGAVFFEKDCLVCAVGSV